MLYVTTRVEDDAFTANRALSENRGPGGGFFVPMQMPSLSPSDLSAMAEKPFARNMADVINQLFNTQLDPGIRHWTPPGKDGESWQPHNGRPDLAQSRLAV